MIRRAGIADTSELAQLYRYVNPPWDADMLLDSMNCEYTRYYVECDDTIFAFVSGEIIYEVASIYTVVVQPSSRRQGTGRRLLQHFIERARLEGAREVLLEVAESNSTAISLYQSLGFVTVATRANYYHEESAYCMRLVL